MITKAHLIYFSPTRTTQTIVARIAAGLAVRETEDYDLTRLPQGCDRHLKDGVAIVGIPVYAGRVPEVCLERLQSLSAAQVPAVLVALYGNREYEDALLELCDLALAKGFSVIAAGAFIGEHSYSTAEQPIAAKRPDAADLQCAYAFGATITEKLRSGETGLGSPLPGNRPYKERVPLGGIAPETNPERCTLCGICAGVCPTFVISLAGEVLTAADRCVMCCACVKSCPEQARAMSHPLVQTRRAMLVSNCNRRKEPTLFL